MGIKNCLKLEVVAHKEGWMGFLKFYLQHQLKGKWKIRKIYQVKGVRLQDGAGLNLNELIFFKLEEVFLESFSEQFIFIFLYITSLFLYSCLIYIIPILH